MSIPLGYKYSPEALANPRAKAREKVWTPENADHRGLHKLGYKCTQETRDKIRAARLGKKHSPATIAKMRGTRRLPEVNARIREHQLSRARAAGLLVGAEDDYVLARSKECPMEEAVGIANRSFLRDQTHIIAPSFLPRSNGWAQ